MCVWLCTSSARVPPRSVNGNMCVYTCSCLELLELCFAEGGSCLQCLLVWIVYLFCRRRRQLKTRHFKTLQSDGRRRHRGNREGQEVILTAKNMLEHRLALWLYPHNYILNGLLWLRILWRWLLSKMEIWDPERQQNKSTCVWSHVGGRSVEFYSMQKCVI